MQQEQESSQLCSNGCGFFGNAASSGMCSVCYKKHLSNRQVESNTSINKVDATPSPAVLTETTVQVAQNVEITQETATPTTDAQASTEDVKIVQTNKKRCWECKKKVGLTAIECRCGFVFCGGHRYPDQHKCPFDFKTNDRAELARRNVGGGQFAKLEKL